MVVPNSVNSTASYWLKETVKEPISIGYPSDNFHAFLLAERDKKAQIRLDFRVTNTLAELYLHGFS
jgi:hypothetical protein